MAEYLSLEEFLNSPLRNSYVRYKHLSAYVRKGKRLIQGNLVSTLELGNINNTYKSHLMNVSYNPGIKRTGLFREFINLMEQLASQYKFNYTYIENVLNDFLPAKLIEMGYIETPYDGLHTPPCFYKPVIPSNKDK